MSQRFIRCAHCGLPHRIDEAVCSVTGRPIELRRSQQRLYETESAAKLAIAKPAVRSSAPPAPFETSADETPALIGQVLGGKYRAMRVLGEGGMGAVYECEHLQLHRRVAVKVLHPAQAKKKASVARFQNEAHVAGAIGHPNICEIYDVGETSDGQPFLVMELLQGETLADRIASEGALPFEDVIELITQVLSGLVAAHEKGIIHRDIKPENVFLTRRQGLPPLVKLLDFGISKVAGADDLNLTRTGMVMGTPFYMSPEQARGDRNLDHRVDLYATGVMLYECLSGRRPYTAANYNALLVQILTTSPRPIVELRPAVPHGFEAVVNRAMARDRNKRYETASDMQRELASLRDPARSPRMASVPPEPVPLVTQRRPGREEPAERAIPREAPPAVSRSVMPPKPREYAAVSVGLDDEDLLDSGTLAPTSRTPSTAREVGDSVSIEIPIVAEEPAPPPPRPSPMPSAAPPPSAPRPLQPRPAPSPVPASSPLPAPPRPRAAVDAPPRAASIPPPLPRPAPAAAPAARNAPPSSQKLTPASVASPPTTREPPKFRGEDAPYLAGEEEDDADPTEVGVLLGARANDTPIDVDATERIPPEKVAAYLAAQRGEAAASGRVGVIADDSDDEGDDAPTTLFDRAATKGLGKKRAAVETPPARVPRPAATDRAPAPTPSKGRAPQQAIPRPPTIPRRKDS